jgi:hypothetical protein
MLKTLLILAVLVVACLSPNAYMGAENKGSSPIGSGLLNDISVAAIGYQAPSRHYTSSRLPTATLDFIDDDHLLFTFHCHQLMNRSTEADGSGEEQTIRATVVDLINNVINGQDDWKMDDHGRYLWTLQNGKFIVRRDNKLLLTASDLRLEPFLDVDRPVVFLSVSPSGKLVELQTLKPDHTVTLQVIQREGGSVLERADIAAPVDLPLSDDGILDVTALGNGRWGVWSRSFSGSHREIAKVASTCQPSLKILSIDKLMVIACVAPNGHREMRLYSSAGKHLWSMKWGKDEIWPNFATSRAETYLAVSFLKTEQTPQGSAPDEETIDKQEVILLDVLSGKPIGHLSMTPVLSDERNFAISPSGHKLAILQGSAIKVFQIP